MVGGRRGVENGPAGGGDSDFSCRGGEALFAPGGGEGYCKIVIKSPKNALVEGILEI